MSVAFEALERSLLQAGQIRVCDDESVSGLGLEFALLELEVLEVEKWIETRDLRLNGWGDVGDEAGQMGVGFAAVADVFEPVEGVREGTQKEGRVCFAD